MYRLSLIALFFLFINKGNAQNPHGEDFKVDCRSCHSAEAWIIDIDTFVFNHDTTSFPLSGQHNFINCIDCHKTLEFAGTANQCIDCHLDMHKQSVGNDCVRCHNTENWLVDNIFELHENNGFPLFGGHDNVSCVNCHISDNDLQFDRLGNECINCHLQDFLATEMPNHVEKGFSTNCIDCHDVAGENWSTEFINHSFFPLTDGHDIEDCKACHLTDNFSDASPECISCHQDDFEMTTSPDHQKLSFDTDCTACHTLNLDWMPAEFRDHDNLYFPIYSGAHQGEWEACVDCHTNANDFSVFTCIACHTNPETDDEHDGVQGYVYEDNACLACHPNGDSDDEFDHNKTNFPLTGEHIGVNCLECHENGFQGTSTNCVDCHVLDFEGSINPDHQELNIGTDCINCHTTEADWMPASFDIHDDFWVIQGAHVAIANDCVACHNGDYNNTPNTCVGCHLDDFNATTNPNHEQAQFSTDCLQCHTEDAWLPVNFDHDSEYFPIYSGVHQGEWNACIDCHINVNDFSVFTCIGCHINPETDDEHIGIAGYVYEDNACLACHPTGDAEMAFDHNQTNFPLTGAHIGIECLDCHSNGFEGTSMDCFSCHQMDFGASINPNHEAIGIGQDCVSCHSTEPDWSPALFDIHDQYYPLIGAHATIASDCVACHNGDYNNTPNTCVGCHIDDYNLTSNPNHLAAQFSLDCVLCHNENAWEPSSFDHDGQYFPIYSGAHNGEWSACVDCHININDYSVFQCIGCHTNPETDQEHEGVSGYVYEDNACLACHPNGDADMSFDHDQTNFPLTGAHLGVQCLDCHENGFEGTSMECVSCHLPDFVASLNPNHQELNLSNDCINCHTTEIDWMPATFDIHDEFYALVGAHAAIAQDCAACHNGDYTNTPNTCVGCHLDNFNATTNPNHIQVMFSTDCVVCHTEDAWEPSTFDHDSQYFPINSGTHLGTWTNCMDCHIDNTNFAIFDCLGCHINPETDMEHVTVGGYIYENNACLACHPTGEAMGSFDHNTTGFPLTGGHIGLDCLECHENGYQGTPTDCFFCHSLDYNESLNPNHMALAIPTDCISCHTTEPGWAPATFDIHDQYYPLTGEHLIIASDCATCHNGDYINTPNTCAGCHNDDYVNTLNPNHIALAIPNDCVNCHTTDADWMPASFDIHDQYYPLNGAHAAIADQCIDCHNGDYNNTPNTCVGCHLNDFNMTTNPNHAQAQFSADCITCHNEDAWIPSTFDHDAQYFPIYSGEHLGEWTTCMDCHLNPNNFAEFTCIGCHINPDTDDEHIGVGGYVYEDLACLACHPTGESAGAFDHDATAFPLTGAHLGIDCLDCHENGFIGTPTNCDACHLDDFNASTNPNHSLLGFPTDCESCHTTDPGWSPATFDIHDDYYELTGAHLDVANDCMICHNGDYNNTPNTCAGCHLNDYNNSTNPNHQDLNIPMDCENCHTTDPGWSPATFDIHDDYYELTGAHLDVANDCIICHNGDYNNTPNTCAGCHIDDHSNSTNPNHQDLNIPISCEDCHTTDPDWMPATFDIHDDYYPLNGAHAIIANQCVDCHNGDYSNTPNTCIGCHLTDYNDATEPDHQQNNLSTDCLSCHNEDAWVPTDFDHDDFWVLNGAHADIANDCFACHMGDYVNTPTECIGCHQADYDGANNPDHSTAMFPTDCLLCHNETEWDPSTFDHDGMYFPIYSGKHENEWTQCIECHIVPTNYAIFSCIDCHEHNNQNDVDDDHDGVNGYIYESNACYACHPNGEE